MNCAICEHEINKVRTSPICSDEDCDGAPKPHWHCGHEDEHGICTSVGCMPDRSNNDN